MGGQGGRLGRGRAIKAGADSPVLFCSAQYWKCKFKYNIVGQLEQEEQQEETTTAPLKPAEEAAIASDGSGAAQQDGAGAGEPNATATGTASATAVDGGRTADGQVSRDGQQQSST